MIGGETNTEGNQYLLPLPWSQGYIDIKYEKVTFHSTWVWTMIQFAVILWIEAVKMASMRPLLVPHFSMAVNTS
jgi:hypothetical protein